MRILTEKDMELLTLKERWDTKFEYLSPPAWVNWALERHGLTKAFRFSELNMLQHYCVSTIDDLLDRIELGEVAVRFVDSRDGPTFIWRATGQHFAFSEHLAAMILARAKRIVGVAQ
jgi:hypothetical protein